MNNVPTEIGLQNPTLYIICAFTLAVLGIVIYIVKHFTKSQETITANINVALKEQSEVFVTSLKDIGANYHAHQTGLTVRSEEREKRAEAREERTTQALDQNSRSLAINSEVLRNIKIPRNSPNKD